MHQARRTGGSLAFESAKMDRTVWCESWVEHRFFAHLEEMNEVLYYQEQPLAIRYKLGKQRRSYYPDALVAFTDGTSVLIEVKQTPRLVDFDNIVKYEAMLERCEKEGWGAFAGDDTMSLRALVQHEVRRALIQAFRTELKSRDISAEWLGWIKQRMQVSTTDVNAAFLKPGLVVESSPFLAREARPEEQAVIEKVFRYFGGTGTLNPPTALAAPSPVNVRVAAAGRARSLHTVSARLDHPNAYTPWTPKDDRLLLSEYTNGMTVPQLSERFGRNRGAIRSRLKKLGALGSADEAQSG